MSYRKLEEIFRLFKKSNPSMSSFLLFPITFLLIVSKPQTCHINILIFIFSPIHQQRPIILDSLYQYTYMPATQGHVFHKANEGPSLA